MTYVDFVYFIRPKGMLGPVKIGCSQCPEWRVNVLMRWSPFELEVAAKAPGNFAVERAIHNKLASSRSHKEWFFPTEEVLRFLDGVMAGASIAALLAEDFFPQPAPEQKAPAPDMGGCA